MWELFPKINKLVGPNIIRPSRQVKIQKRIKNITLLLGTSEYYERQSNKNFKK